MRTLGLTSLFASAYYPLNNIYSTLNLNSYWVLFYLAGRGIRCYLHHESETTIPRKMVHVWG